MPDSKPTILFVDDERFFARDYINALSAKFAVEFCEEVDEARRILCSPDTHIAAAVVDLQMPSPMELEDDEVVHFVDTGLWLLEKAFVNIVKRALPVVILTNREFPTFKERFEAMGFPERLVEVHIKFNTPSKKLITVMNQMMDYWDPTKLGS